MVVSGQFIDVAFPIMGHMIPYEHGYPLYSALSRLIPEIHTARDVGIFQIPSTSDGKGHGILKSARLKIRAPADLYPALVPLAGKSVELDGHRVAIGIPFAYSLQPASVLESKIVVIKGYTEPSGFADGVERQLREMDISDKSKIGKRRVVRIKDKSVVGFAVRVSALTDRDSLKLLQYGLGGRRKMGCGLFEPREKVGR